MTEAELESIAQQLVARLRDDDPEAVNRWLSLVMPNPTDWYRLCFVLAAAVPDDQRWSELTAWWTNPPAGTEPVEFRRQPVMPCGTAAAYRRHRKANEAPCQPCADAERARDRDRRQRQRAAKNGGESVAA
jgi:hypothetical protein